MLDLVSTIGVFAQEGLGGLATITELILTVSKPRAHLFADTALDGHVQNRALFRDARAVHDVELSRAERCGHFVLNDLGTHTIADDLLSLSLMLSMRRISIRTDEKNLRARPPVVALGSPNMTPSIFSRSWLMKMQVVLDLASEPASLRSAWLIRRA